MGPRCFSPVLVVRRGGSTVRAGSDASAYVHLRALEERERAWLEQEQKGNGESLASTGVRSFEATRPWIERTGWDVTYQGVRRDLLQNLADLPSPQSCRMGHLLCPRRGEAGLVSVGADEQKIAYLVDAVDRMLDRCEETIRHTGRPILYWLRTFRPTPCYPKPFVFLGPNTSRVTYRRYWKRFIAFIFRVFCLEAGLRKQFRVRLKKTQRTLLQSIWAHTEWAHLLQDGRCLRKDREGKPVSAPWKGVAENDENQDSENDEEASKDDRETSDNNETNAYY